jgi:hypothetical protein
VKDSAETLWASRLPLGGQARGWHTMDLFLGNESFQLGMMFLIRQIGRLS